MQYTRWFFAAFLVLAAAAPARATVTTFLDEPSLAHRAQSVVRGRVVAQSVVVIDGRLWTDSTLIVDEVWKGNLRAGGRMLVRQPGGQRGGVGMLVVGAARFSVGEAVLLFARWSSGRHRPIGMAQGKFSLYRDRAGVPRARRDLSGLSFVTLDARGYTSVKGSAGLASDRSLDELRATVVRAVAGGAR